MGGLFDSKPLHHGEPIRRVLMGPSLTNQPMALIAGELASMQHRLDIGFQNPIRCCFDKHTAALHGRCWSDGVFDLPYSDCALQAWYSLGPLCECFVSWLLISRELEPLDSDRHM